MAEAMLYRLRIDPEFKGLIPPMAQKEYIQLEMNLRSDGCRDPIVIWNSTIVDGHNRYQICHKYKIPFRIVEMNFGSREEAKVWICSNQLGRRNISVEYRRYLIGSQYELEKQIEQNRNKAGNNQYTENNTSQTTPQQGHSNHSTAVRLANEHHISEATVQKYAGFTRAINKLGQKAPDMVPKLLTGQYKVSQDGVAQMAKMEPEELAKVASHFQEQQKPDYLPYSGARQGINAGKTQDVRLFATPWTVAHQAPLPMGFSRQEYWSGLPFPSPGDLPNPGIEPGSPGNAISSTSFVHSDAF